MCMYIYIYVYIHTYREKVCVYYRIVLTYDIGLYSMMSTIYVHVYTVL